MKGTTGWGASYDNLPVPANLGGLTPSATNLVFSGINGQAGATCHLLTSTDLSPSLSQWPPVATILLSPNGNFTLTAASALLRSPPAPFYILQQQ